MGDESRLISGCKCPFTMKGEGMKRLRLMVVLVLLLSALALSACGNGGHKTTAFVIDDEDLVLSENFDNESLDTDEEADSSSNEPVISKEAAASILDSQSYSLDELLSLEEGRCYVVREQETGYAMAIFSTRPGEGYCIKRGERFFPVAWRPPVSDYGYDGDDVYPTDCLPCEKYQWSSDPYSDEMGIQHSFNNMKPEEGFLITIDRTAGDKLVTFVDSDEYRFLQILGGKYVDDISNASEEKYAKDLFSEAAEVNGVEVNGDVDRAIQVLEDSGLTLETLMPSLSNCGASFSSVSPTSYTIGTYEGTRYKETTVPVDQWKLLYGGESVACPPIATKEGYFEIDISKVPAGIYYFQGTGSIVKVV